ncbi:MAG TPA: GNAT family N-acetyltransferase [Fimbriimonas sp.]|nr:GNAT family N-acetyltransferase [Fimbriimonas sp.]
MLRTRVYSGSGLFEELERPWKELVGASPTATPFQTWEWQSIWGKHYLGLKRPVLFAFYEGSDLVGLVPMVKVVGPWRTLRPMGIGPSDYLHPLAREGYEQAVADMLVSELGDLKDVDLIDLQQVRETRALAESMKGTVIEQATCLSLDLPSSFDAYLQSLGKSLRYDVRKLEKALFQSGQATVEPVPIEETSKGMEILFEQHKKRWQAKQWLIGGLALSGAGKFHREWAQRANENGWLWLSVLNLDGQPIGAIYGMTLGTSVYYYQAGFDPTKGSVSPGTLLVATTIKRAIAEGKKHFDFMRGDEPYKRRWKPQHVLRNLRFLMPANGLLGSVGTQWNQMGSRVESRVRARLEGKGLL